MLRSVFGIACIGTCVSLYHSTRQNIIIQCFISDWGGWTGRAYLGRPGRWAAEVDLVAHGAAETAAGDGAGGRHGL